MLEEIQNSLENPIGHGYVFSFSVTRFRNFLQMKIKNMNKIFSAIHIMGSLNRAAIKPDCFFNNRVRFSKVVNKTFPTYIIII